MLEKLQYLIENDKLSHAYLFEGANKAQLKAEAMLFAQHILCNEDEVCHSRVAGQNHSDFLLLETDEATIKKEMIEHVLHRMNQKPIEGTHKVYIIMDFDKVTPQGENSILKFLEEPPENTIAILVTSAPKSILPTIHSRCQHIYVQAEHQDLAMQLSERGIPAAVLSTMSQLNMSEQDAISWYEEHDFKSMRGFIIKWCQSLLHNDTMSLIQIVELLEVLNSREKQLVGIDMVQLYLQDVMYILIQEESVASFPDAKEQLAEHARTLSVTSCIQMIDHALKAKQKLLQYVNVTLVFEQMAINIAKEVTR